MTTVRGDVRVVFGLGLLLEDVTNGKKLSGSFGFFLLWMDTLNE